ncbi:MAG: hypothetical protein IJ733_06570 [Lachnospiraceae bacterium]|nr:hypothetical protein [Lachnospiraceae bacterium]
MRKQSIRLQMPEIDQMDSNSLITTFQQMHRTYMEAVMASDMVSEDMKGRVLFSAKEKLEEKLSEEKGRCKHSA